MIDLDIEIYFCVPCGVQIYMFKFKSGDKCASKTKGKGGKARHWAIWDQ